MAQPRVEDLKLKEKYPQDGALFTWIASVKTIYEQVAAYAEAAPYPGLSSSLTPRTQDLSARLGGTYLPQDSQTRMCLAACLARGLLNISNPSISVWRCSLRIFLWFKSERFPQKKLLDKRYSQ